MTMPDDQHEAWLQSRLVAYDEALGEGSQPPLVELPIDEDAELATRLRAAQDCLEMLDRARRHWTLDDMSTAGDTFAHDPGVEPPRTVGRFQIHEELGRGGLGIVYLAEDPRLGRKVAVKVPRFEVVSSQSSRRRFLREADAAARLSHPNLIALYEVGEDGPACYLASEYCAGPTLAAWLRERATPVPLSQAATLVLKLAEAVQHAHSRGVLHRDIKPSNVLLADVEPGADEVLRRVQLDVSPKLTDFGMAKLLEQTSGETRTGAIIGTLAYMSPEQAEGRIDELDARTDVYALGAILYELLTGAAPFRGKTDIDTLRQLVINEPTPPRRLRPSIPRDLEAITLKCLAKRPADRYTTAHELAADIERFMSGDPTAARPLGALERTGKWARRRPALAALMGVSLAAAIGLIGGGTAYNARLQAALGLAAGYNTQMQTALSDARQLLYAADMKLAFDAWHGDNASVLEQRLERFEPVNGQADLRTFPWYFLSRQCQGDQTDLYSHATTVFAVAWSPRGDLVATGAAGGEIRLWDVAAGRVHKTLHDHRTDVNDLAFSPDGRLLASCGDDFVLRVWEVDGDDAPRVLRTGTLRDVNGIAFSPDGRWLAACGEDHIVRIWDTESWKVNKVLTGGASAMNRIAFSPDSRRLAISQSSGLGTIIDLESGEAIVTLDPQESPQRRMGALAFSPDGRSLATVSIEAQQVRFWEPQTGKLVRSLHSEGNWIHAMAFSPDGRRLITGHQDGALRVWDVEALENVHVLLGHANEVRDLAVAPEGDRVVSAGQGGAVKVWDLTAIDHRKSRSEFPKLVRTVAFSPEHDLFAFEERFGPVRLMDVRTRSILFESEVSREDADPFLAFSSSGKYLAYAICDSRSIEVVDVAARKPVTHLVAASGRFRSIAFLQGSEVLATGNDQSVFALWDVSAAQEMRACNTGQGIIHALASFAGGDRLVVAGEKGIRIWSVPTPERSIPLDSASRKVIDLAVSPDESLLTGASNGGEVLVWDLAKCQLRTLLVGHRGWSNSVSFSPDGKTLASAGDDGTVRLWDVRTLQEVGVMVTSNDSSCHCHSVAFSPDGLTLAAGGNLPQDRGELLIFSAANRRHDKPR